MKLQQTIQWIPVEERLLTEGAKYLIAFRDGSFSAALFKAGIFWTLPGRYRISRSRVSHFAELVDPLKLAELTTEKAVEILTT